VPASTVSQFNRLLGSDGAVFIKKLGSFLCGGRKMRLEVDTQAAVADEAPMLRPLGAMASLLLLDTSILSPDSLLALVTATLLPFFGLHGSAVLREPVQPQNDRQPVAAPIPGRRRGAIEFARDLIARPNMNAGDARNFIVEMTDSFSTIIGGPRGARGAGRVITEICNTVFYVLGQALARRYTPLEVNERAFNYDPEGDNNPLTPFYVDGGIQDAVLLGTGMYYTDAHLPECRAMHNNLLQYAESLSKIQEVGNIMPILRVAFAEAKHISRSNALFVSSQLACAADEQDILPFRVREDIPLDIVSLPYLGALSYLVFGVNSSEDSESYTPFLNYKPRLEIKLPSKYGMYLYMEKAICNAVFARFSDVELQYHLKKQPRLVKLSLDILSKFFQTLDPKSESRVTELFLNWDRYLSNANGFVHRERVPNELTNPLLQEMMIPTLNEQNAPYGRMLLGEPVRPVKTPSVLEHAMDIPNMLIDEVFITQEPIDTVTYINNKMQRVSVYSLRERPVMFTDLDDLLRRTPYVYDSKLSVTTIRKLMQQGGIATVRVSDMRTTFDLKEQTGYNDVVIMDGEISIERKMEANEFKYAMSSIPLFYKPQHDELAVDEQGRRGPGVLNETFSTYVGIPYEAFERYLINHDGVLGNDPEQMNNDTNLRLKDGSGFVYSVPVTVAHRDSESLAIKKTLEMRKIF
jgi:hypothetical protein